eukprot:jgi/Tetstr1/458226/TSEL_044714.t1
MLRYMTAKVPQSVKAVMRPFIMSDTPGRAIAKLPREMREKIRDYDGFQTAVIAWKKFLLGLLKGCTTIDFADVSESAFAPILSADMAPVGAGESVGEVPHNNLVVFDIEPSAVAVSFSSEGFLRNLRRAELSDLSVFLVTDSTHKIHYKTWMLLPVGTYSIEYDPDKKNLVHRYRHIFFAFAASESGASVSFLFTPLFAAHHQIHGTTVPVVKCVVSDKGTGIHAAIRSTLPDAQRGANAPRPGQRGANAPRPGQRGANAPRPGQRGTNAPRPGQRGANAPRPAQRRRQRAAAGAARRQRAAAGACW